MDFHSIAYNFHVNITRSCYWIAKWKSPYLSVYYPLTMLKQLKQKIQKCQVSCTNLFDLLFWVQSDNAMKCERHRKISKCLNLLCELRPSCSTIQPVFKTDVLFCVPTLLHNLVHAYVAPYNNEHIFLLLGNDMITKETNFFATFPITSNILPA